MKNKHQAKRSELVGELEAAQRKLESFDLLFPQEKEKRSGPKLPRGQLQASVIAAIATVPAEFSKDQIVAAIGNGVKPQAVWIVLNKLTKSKTLKSVSRASGRWRNRQQRHPWRM